MSIAWDILLSSHAGQLMYANGTLADTKTLIPSSGLMDGVLQKVTNKKGSKMEPFFICTAFSLIYKKKATQFLEWLRS